MALSAHASVSSYLLRSELEALHEICYVSPRMSISKFQVIMFLAQPGIEY